MNPYRYFSIFFSYPTEATLWDIREIAKTGALGVRSAEILGAVSLEDAQTEYTRLFISAYPRLLCPPYESYYREGVVYGNSTIEVGEWYRKSGLDFNFEGEPSDVLSAELDFMALTNDQSFLTRMREWVFEFTERVQKHSAIYGVAAAELEHLLRQEEVTTEAPHLTV